MDTILVLSLAQKTFSTFEMTGLSWRQANGHSGKATLFWKGTKDVVSYTSKTLKDVLVKQEKAKSVQTETLKSRNHV